MIFKSPTSQKSLPNKPKGNGTQKVREELLEKEEEMLKKWGGNCTCPKDSDDCDK